MQRAGAATTAALIFIAKRQRAKRTSDKVADSAPLSVTEVTLRPINSGPIGVRLTQKMSIGYFTRSALMIFTGGSSIWPFIGPSPLVGETGAS